MVEKILKLKMTNILTAVLHGTYSYYFSLILFKNSHFYLNKFQNLQIKVKTVLQNETRSFIVRVSDNLLSCKREMFPFKSCTLL